MDPVEAGDWLAGRPLQLIYLMGLDPANRPHHNTIVNTFRARASEKPLQVRVISGELDLPSKPEKKQTKGILRREWPQKYLDRVPALIVLFIDLDWNHPSWSEKKSEAESKVASIRAELRHGSRLALVMIQERETPSTPDDSQAADRAHELCQACALQAKNLFILPINGDVTAYISKLESAFHDMAQGFYQQKLKAIRSRNIPNNSPALLVRQQFKLAFLSELRQDTHTALRHYRLAYDQCRDTLSQWEGIDIFEWRSVTGLLNYKMCELCFLHSTALEAINQMRKHQAIFFAASPGIYPTPSLASIELLLWKAKQCWHFAQLFEQAVIGGLSALATLNPGTHLDQAAMIYSQANNEIGNLKINSPAIGPYPVPDPLERTTDFFGQRPWRDGLDGLATAEIEAAAVNAITQRLVVNHEGVISLLTAAMSQFKKYGCVRMQKKVMYEMADVCYSNNDISKALQLWSLVSRDSALPSMLRNYIIHRATWASYAIASVKDFASCCMQLMSPSYSSVLPSKGEDAFFDLLAVKVPCVPFPNDDVSPQLVASYHQNWQKALSERQFFNIQASRIESFINVRVSFLENQIVELNTRIPIRIEIMSNFSRNIRLSNVTVKCKLKSSDTKFADVVFDPIILGNAEISPGKPTKKLAVLDLKQGRQNDIVSVSEVLLEFGDKNSFIYGQLEFDEKSLNRNLPINDVIGVEMVKISGIRSAVRLKEELTVECLIGEVSTTQMKLMNYSKSNVRNVRMEFKRNEQKFTEAAAVLFVDKGGTELKSEYSVDVSSMMEAQNMVIVPISFSAQLIGDYDLQLELSYDCFENEGWKKETVQVPVGVRAKDPFTVTSGIMNINGIPMTAILNHCEHILNVEILATASIIIDSVEFLMADVVTLCDTSNGGAGHNLNDVIDRDEIICYSAAIRVSAKEENSETPLGRLAIEWKRSTPGGCPVRSVVPLCRIPVFPCPISIDAIIKASPVSVRQPIDICFELKNHSQEVIEMHVNFELTDNFMFSGERKVTVAVLPNSFRRINVVVMALSAGRLIFPRIILKSPTIEDQQLQQALRTLPATIFVLPKAKELEVVKN